MNTASVSSYQPIAFTRRTFSVEQYDVLCETSPRGDCQWTCRCAEFRRLAGAGAHCFHVAIAIDQVLEETTDKVFWHTANHRRQR